MDTTNQQNNNHNRLVCPECDTPFNPPNELIEGKILECPACGVQSEIITVNPLKLAPLEEEK